MGNIPYTTQSVPFSEVTFGGGLNSNAGPLGVADNEASDIQNIDHDNFKSIKQRKGYLVLNSTAVPGTGTCYGLHWYESNVGGSYTAWAIGVFRSTSNYAAIYKMDGLDGTWDNITGSATIANKQVDFCNFLNEVYITGEDTGFIKWTGGGNVLNVLTPANLQWAKYVEEFNNHLILSNVKVEGTQHNSRFYWSELKDTGAWTSTNFIEIAKDDGQEITRIKKLGDRLVQYKTRSVYNVFYTDDPDIPFILPGGGKSNSSVGCVAPYSVQEINNAHVFFSYDGFYIYDGMNSYKFSDKITPTLVSYKNSQFEYMPSLYYQTKNMYWTAWTHNSSSTNAEIITYNTYLNAFSKYKGIESSAMTMFKVNKIDERPYFADYAGYVYRADYGYDDMPAKVTAAVSSYYYTNWRSYGDIIDKKGIPHVVILHQIEDTSMDFSYSYDLEIGWQFTQSVSLSASGALWGTATWNNALWGREGGNIIRRDLTGRGRLVRFGLAHNESGTSFQIDGLGSMAYLETGK